MLLNGHRLLEETKVSQGEIWGKEGEARVNGFGDKVRDDIGLYLSYGLFFTSFFGVGLVRLR
jgi:hypothetical protein